MQQWFLIENEEEYKAATARFEQIRDAKKGTPEYREKLLLVRLVSDYGEAQWSLPEIDPIEMIKERMDDLDLKASDLAKAYGDKGTVSKVLNYKQALSLNMIRIFAKLLRMPPELLIKEYPLKRSKK